ncbi:hypothetical protein V8E52_007475 [Russula decolorans]
MIPETKITLVREADFETSKEPYARIHLVHIYSLSPSPIHVSIIPIPLSYYAIAFTVALGRITGPDWYIKELTDQQQRRPSSKAKSSATTTATSSTSKNKLPGLSKAPSTTEDAKPVVKSEPKDIKPQIKEEPTRPAKRSRKLDFHVSFLFPGLVHLRSCPLSLIRHYTIRLTHACASQMDA